MKTTSFPLRVPAPPPPNPFYRAFKFCAVCGKALTKPDSLSAGIGPECMRKLREKVESGSSTLTLAELPFDVSTGDMVCARRTVEIAPDWRQSGPDAPTHYTKPVFNITQTLYLHSRSGFEFSYYGAGAKDFALNMLNLYVPALKQGDPKWWEMPVTFPTTKITSSRFAADQYERFARDFIAPMPHDGATVPGELIRLWIVARIVESEKAQLGLF